HSLLIVHCERDLTSLFQAHRAAKAVVAVLVLRRDAAPRCYASNLDLVPPRTSTRSPPRAARRTRRVDWRRVEIVILIIPIRTPLVNVLGDVVKPEPIWRSLADSFGPVQPQRRIIRLSLRRFISPRVQLAFESASRCAFPLGFGWKAVEFACFL